MPATYQPVVEEAANTAGLGLANLSTHAPAWCAAKILRCTSIQKSNTDPQKDFLPLDPEVWCIRKIVGLL
jgi:hypothetical protein